MFKEHIWLFLIYICLYGICNVHNKNCIASDMSTWFCLLAWILETIFHLLHISFTPLLHFDMKLEFSVLWAVNHWVHGWQSRTAAATEPLAAAWETEYRKLGSKAPTKLQKLASSPSKQKGRPTAKITKESRTVMQSEGKEKKRAKYLCLKHSFWLGEERKISSISRLATQQGKHGNSLFAAVEAKQIWLGLWGLASFSLLVTDCFPKKWTG